RRADPAQPGALPVQPRPAAPGRPAMAARQARRDNPQHPSEPSDMQPTWHLKHHSELDKRELYALLELRSRVFVVEQHCPYQDVDGQDLLGDTCHLLAWQDERLLAYLRLLDPATQGGEAVIGRVLVAPEA